jgi:hypothetical protein
MGVFEKRVPKKVFGMKREGGVKENITLRNFIIYTR